MKFAGRINSFINQGGDIFEAIENFQNIEGITHLELNYPEHVVPYGIDSIKKAIGPLQINGISTRFRSHFIGGEFTNRDEKIIREAINLCKNAADTCQELGGKVLTVWLGYDGFDYPFQIDYENKWNIIINCFHEIASYAKDIKVSIEYKPYEPRAYSMIDSIGLVLLAIQEIGLPNLGVTLDFCHLLMKHENPAYSVVLAAKSDKLFGLHLNDGYSRMDDGLMFGSVNLAQAIELVFYLKKYRYDGVIFFDSFPIRENAADEISTNIQVFNKISTAIDTLGFQHINEIISEQSGLSANKLILEMFK